MGEKKEKSKSRFNVRVIERTTPDYSATDDVKVEFNYAEGRWVNCANCPYAKFGEGKLEFHIN